MIKALTIENGLIQDKEIDGIPVKLLIVKPSGTVRNVRTLTKMKQTIGITNHNTANASSTAGSEAHARYLQNMENGNSTYVSVHFFVDYECIVQCVPLDEFCYHAGDGSGDGNRKTISIEICENKEIELAEENAKKLNAALLLTYPDLKIYKHQDWSGKYCPHIILDKSNGWETFVNDIYSYVEKSKEEEEMEKVYNWTLEVPEWGRPTVQKLLDKGYLKGNDKGELQITESMLRMLVINDRAGCYNL